MHALTRLPDRISPCQGPERFELSECSSHTTDTDYIVGLTNLEIPDSETMAGRRVFCAEYNKL